VAAIVLVSGAGLMVAESASAHTPNVSANCSTLTVTASSYTSSTPPKNTVTVTINGVAQPVVTFAASMSKTYTFASSTVSNNYAVTFFAWDAPNNPDYSKTFQGSTTGCTPPVTDDATASVTVVPATCTAAGTATPGDVSNAKWNSTAVTTGPGSYNYTATATSGHAFQGGSATKSFTGQLDGPSGYQNSNPTAPCYQPTKEAAAAVTVTQPTCAAPATATPGAAQNASWNSTATTSGPGNYGYTATATSGHEFSDGATSKSFSGQLAGPIGYQSIDKDRPCYQEPPKDANATMIMTPATCTAAASATPGTVQNASWNSTKDVTGPGNYAFTATANSGHEFPNGQATRSFAGKLLGAIGYQNTDSTQPCYQAPASAAMTITPATCTTPATAVPGAVTDASWATDSKTVTGPGSYTFTATAENGHEFVSGDASKTFTGTLAGTLPKQSTDASAPCYVAPASTPTTPATPTKTTVATSNLADTGSDVTIPIVMVLTLLLVGSAALVTNRIMTRRRRA
jgi:hypothetical protein